MSSDKRYTASLGSAVAHGLELLARGRDPFPVVSEHLGRALSADLFAYGRLAIPEAQCDLRFWPAPVDTELMVQATMEMPGTHPLLAHWLRGNSDANALSALITDRRAWRRTAAYSVLTRGMGCTENAGIRIDAGRQTLFMIGFARESDLNAAELAFLQAARQPVIALHRHAVQLASWRGSLDGKTRDAEQVAAELGLTSRELEVLHLLSQGLLAASIASRLAISPRTVHRHLSNLYPKLAARDRLTAVARAQKLGLLAPPTLTPRH